MRLPCGRCSECLKRRVSGWSFRLRKESYTAKSAHFITLTYNENHVPMSGHGFMTLNKRHLQLFFKKLRIYEQRKGNNQKITYYACGEYGGRTNRPHYHIILLNASVECVERAWSIDGTPIGGIHCGEVNAASIGYTLKYIAKPGRIPMFERDDRIPEFALQSKGIGRNYLGRFERVYSRDIEYRTRGGNTAIRRVYRSILIDQSRSFRWHRKQLLDRMFIPIEDGKTIAMPTFYKNYIYSKAERLVIASHNKELRPDPEWTETEKINDLRARNNSYFKNTEKNRKL